MMNNFQIFQKAKFVIQILFRINRKTKLKQIFMNLKITPYLIIHSIKTY